MDRNTGHCFLLPCPNKKRDAATLLPLINRWILPGSVVYTDEWAAHNGLTAAAYTHHSANNSIQFVDPATGVHTNTQEGLWATTGLLKSTFYKWKPVAEMKIVDTAQHRYFVEAHENPADVLNSCRTAMKEEQYLQISREMRKNGGLLKKN